MYRMSVLLDYFLCVRDGKLLIVKVHLTFGGQRSIIQFYQCLRFQERTLKWFTGAMKFQNLMIFLTIIWQIIGYQYNVLKHLLATTILS